MNALAAARKWEQPLYSKLILALVLVAMLFASLPAANVLADSGEEEQPWEKIDLEKEWKDKLHLLRYEGFFYDRVRLYPADFETNADLALAQLYLDKYGVALRQANTVALNHTGFDLKGNVTNGRLAYDTVHDLAMYLHIMRGMRAKMDEVPGGK